MNRVIISGDRIEYDVRRGRVRGECGELFEIRKPTGGKVLAIDPQKKSAWVLLDGETFERRVPLSELRPGRPPKKRCGRC